MSNDDVTAIAEAMLDTRRPDRALGPHVQDAADTFALIEDALRLEYRGLARLAIKVLRERGWRQCDCFDNHKNADVTEASCGCCIRNHVSSPTPGMRMVPGDRTVREIALAAMIEMRQQGESFEMCARWISERVHAAASPLAPSLRAQEAITRVLNMKLRSRIAGDVASEILEVLYRIAPSPESGWRDLATAPRDGTRFLAFTADYQYGHRFNERVQEARCSGRTPDDRVGHFQSTNGQIVVAWQPLPPPPAEETET